LVVAQRRPATFSEKRRKDLIQGEAVLEVLLEDRPGEIYFAADAARKMPDKFLKQLRTGVGQLASEQLREEIQAIIS